MSDTIFSDKLEDLIPRYPDLTKNDSQKVFFGLAEIHSLASTKEVEKRVKPGEYYKHQRVVGRTIIYVDRHLIISDPGTGKTCAFTLSNEMIKKNTNLFKTYYYITPASLQESTKNQIICKCTNNIYIDDKANIKADIRKSGKQEFSTAYRMATYDEFFKMIIHSYDEKTKVCVGKTVAELNVEFGYCFFNLDEVTELITLKLTTASPTNNNGLVGWTESIIGDLKLLKEISASYNGDLRILDDPRIINNRRWYVQYWRFFHAVNNSKAIFASGTIVSNRSAEFFLICNILLPLNKQFDVEYFANNVFTLNLTKYSYYLNGLISYVKASSVVARANYIGKPLDKTYKVAYPMDEVSENPQIGIKEYKSQFNLYKVELFGYQATSLYNHRDKLVSEQIAPTISQMLCCVDNKGQIGTRASTNGEYVLTIGNIGLSNTIMRQYSCSMLWEIVKIESYAYLNALNKGLKGPGVCFSYLELTETVVPIMKALFRFAGFEILDNFSNLLSGNGNYYTSSSETFQRLTKKPRAVFLSGDTSTNEKIRTIVTQIASSKDNINGEYIQFINGSNVMAVGINIGNAKRFIRPLPEWNEAKDRQSRDRVFREDSHDGQREVIADQIAAETGVRPGLYDFDVFVDVYNMCAYARYFYVDRSFYPYFVNDPKNEAEIVTTPFQLDTNPNDQSKKMIHLDSIGMLIDSMKTLHLVGFSKRGEIDGKIGTYTDMGYGTKGGFLCSEYAMAGDILHEKLSDKIGVNISPDLSHLGMDNMDIIFSFSGVLFGANQTEEIISFMSSNALIYHRNCHFITNNEVGNYPYGHAFVIRFKKLKQIKENDGTLKFETRKTNGGAKANEDFFMIQSAMRYISPSESQYIKMEEKSFASKRITRYAKQMALDCIVEEARNYNDKDKDGSAECDYGECNYTCSSNILTGKSEDAFIYEGGGEFWSNYEILYGDLIISECKEFIIALLIQKGKVKISEIFEKLMPKCQREYFINMAIYSLIITKKRINNSFGTTAYVAANKDTLYLSEEFPRTIKNTTENIGMYDNKLIAVKTDPDYRNYMNIDDPIIVQIESLYRNPADANYQNAIIKDIISLILTFKVPYVSITKLIENAFGRIAYYKTITDPSMRDPQFNIRPCDQFICGHIYSIRCFEIIDSGYSYFVHNQPIVRASSRQGEVARLLNASDPFKVFVLKDGRPFWKNATPEENKRFSSEARRDIQTRINNSITKTLNITYADGIVRPTVVESFYYLNYYNGNYRLAKRSKQDGERLDTLNNSSVYPMLEWMRKSYFIYDRDNAVMLDAISNAIQNGKESERNQLLKRFFENNGLIFHFSIEALADHKKRR